MADQEQRRSAHTRRSRLQDSSGPQRSPVPRVQITRLSRRSLLVKFPLPETMGGPRRSPRWELPAVPAARTLPSYDRDSWTRLTMNPNLSRIATAIQGLGLKPVNRRGIPKFESPLIRQLANAISNVAVELPKNVEDLIDAASDVKRLDVDIAALLDRFGVEIWGRNSERTWLSKAHDRSEGYKKDLIFEDPTDQSVLKHHLRMWILLKAFNTLRNGTQLNPKQKHKAEDAQQLAVARDESEIDVTAVQASNLLSLENYWDEKIWRRFVKASPLPFSTFISCLGLKTRLVYGRTIFDHLAAKDLSAEVNNIATRLYIQLSVETLVSYAADPDFLDEEIDVLLYEYAPQIWGMDADRTELLKPGVDDTYVKDLVYEDDEDRKLLWMNIHRWIFARSFKILRQSGSSVEVKQGMIAALNHDNSSPNIFRVPERLYMLTPSSIEDAQEHNKKRNAFTAANYSGPKQPASHETQGSMLKRRETSLSMTENQKLPSKKQKGKDSMPRSSIDKADEEASRVSPFDVSGLTTRFLNYLQNYEQSDSLATSVLNSIDQDLTQVVSTLPVLLNNEPYATIFANLFASWITYRRTILAVRKQVAALPIEQPNEIKAKMTRSRLLTKLRKARDEFVGTKYNGKSAEEVVCLGFGKLQGTAEEGEEVMLTIREGFRKLDDKLVELGDLLGGGNWIMMG
ncbi:uncharacterized protein K460DRAFT_420068 [Cucurbitaria berberidis CBS 394.84]|uniref:Uncharacterized protein n=1 Tax=Cucurbitaria berberidis CBS 394.84 TaxID=1168544 RepID=A0A9P4GAN0_9PLEO|nr:uncharacterized protein K460DRAFT_420068 [Cucurbitaria berberidis CBS 394.84]KAF1842117.1 hypothetical protein K460DRAFT_420068 [Cucurbitaria berberidis CBS 394.84]